MNLGQWAKFLRTLSFKYIGAALLSAAVITRSFHHVQLQWIIVIYTLWEWIEMERGKVTSLLTASLGCEMCM